MTGFIYKITNKVTNQSYIGQTLKTVKQRWASHLSPSSNCVFLFNAISKYGKDSFIVETIHTVESEDRKELILKLSELEKETIKTNNTLAPNGYNLQAGGKNSYRKSAPRKSWKLEQITKDRIATANVGLKRPWMKDHAVKMSESNKRPIIANETGQTWPSIKEAAASFNVKPEAIHRVLRGQRKRFRKLTFSYLQQS